MTCRNYNLLYCTCNQQQKNGWIFALNLYIMVEVMISMCQITMVSGKYNNTKVVYNNALP